MFSQSNIPRYAQPATNNSPRYTIRDYDGNLISEETRHSNADLRHNCTNGKSLCPVRAPDSRFFKFLHQFFSLSVVHFFERLPKHCEEYLHLYCFNGIAVLPIRF